MKTRDLETCRRKKAYGKYQARCEAARLHQTTGCRVHAYVCPLGGHYHVGTYRPVKPRVRRG